MENCPTKEEQNDNNIYVCNLKTRGERKATKGVKSRRPNIGRREGNERPKTRANKNVDQF